MASFWSLGSYLGLTPLRSAKTQLGQFSKDIFFMEKINLRYVIQCKQRLLGRPCTQKRKESMGNSVVKLWGQKGFGHLSSSLSGHLKPLVSLQPNGGFHNLDLRWLCIWNGGHGVRYIVNSEFQCFFVDTPTSSHGTNSCAGDRESWQLDWHFFQSKLSPLFSFDRSQDAPRLHQPCGRLRWRAVGTLSRFASKRSEMWGILQEVIKGDIERKGNNRKEIGRKQDAQRRKNQNDKRERESPARHGCSLSVTAESTEIHSLSSSVCLPVWPGPVSTDERRFHCSDKAPKRNSYRKKDGSWLTVSKTLAKSWIAVLL